MSRSLTFALVLALGGVAAPVAGAQTLATLDPAVVPAEAFAADDEDALEAEEEYVDDEEYVEEEMEYCGDGEMSVVDEVYDEMEYGDAERAYERLVAALRAGEVEEWERARGVALLAELQLRRGEPGRAVVNFLRAEQIEPGSTTASRVQLATALYLRGEAADALEEARTAHDEQCSDPYAVASCYTANVLLSRAEPDAEARVAAASAAATLREGHPDLATVFDATDARITGS